MDSPVGDKTAHHQEPTDYSLSEAAELYELSIRTLGNRLRNGEIPGCKTRGPWGDQWRVTSQALEAFGYQRRQAPQPAVDEDMRTPALAELERELLAARRAAAVERNRADEADRKLSEAMRELGQLRAALSRQARQIRGGTLFDLTDDSKSQPAPGAS